MGDLLAEIEEYTRENRDRLQPIIMKDLDAQIAKMSHAEKTEIEESILLILRSLKVAFAWLLLLDAKGEKQK